MPAPGTPAGHRVQRRNRADDPPVRRERPAQGLVRPVPHADQLLEHGVPSRPVAADDDQPAGDDPVRRPVPAGAFRRRAGRRRGAGRRLERQLQGGVRQRPRQRHQPRAATPATTTTFARTLAERSSRSRTASTASSSAARSTATRSRCPSTRDFGERIVAGARRVPEGDARAHRGSRGRPPPAGRTPRSSPGITRTTSRRRTGCRSSITCSGSRTSASSTSASTRRTSCSGAAVPNLDRVDGRLAVRRVAVRGAQGRVPQLDAAAAASRATTAASFRSASRSDGDARAPVHRAATAARRGRGVPARARPGRACRARRRTTSPSSCIRTCRWTT